MRVEIAELFQTEQLGENWTGYIDQLSQLLCAYRCRDESYNRAIVSLQPIREAEHSLGSLFSDAEALISMFYRMTDL